MNQPLPSCILLILISEESWISDLCDERIAFRFVLFVKLKMVNYFLLEEPRLIWNRGTVASRLWVWIFRRMCLSEDMSGNLSSENYSQILVDLKMRDESSYLFEVKTFYSGWYFLKIPSEFYRNFMEIQTHFSNKMRSKWRINLISFRFLNHKALLSPTLKTVFYFIILVFLSPNPKTLHFLFCTQKRESY